MRKLLSILLIVVMFSCTLVTCNHIHDENCGYDSINKTGCTHVCEEIVEPYIGKWPDK